MWFADVESGSRAVTLKCEPSQMPRIFSCVPVLFALHCLRGSTQGALHCLVLQLDSIFSTLQNRSLWPASLAPRLGEAPKVILISNANIVLEEKLAILPSHSPQ
jgi:hypothetical protein